MSKKKKKQKRKLNIRKWGVKNALALSAIFISILSLWLTLAGLPGRIYPLAPSGYAIIRGNGGFPSDHLVIPIQWHNSSGQPKVVREPKLQLINSISGEEINFLLAGEFERISEEIFSGEIIYNTSFSIDPYSIELRNLVFHIENWYDVKDCETYNFRFKVDEQYLAKIIFSDNLGNQFDGDQFNLPIYDEVKDLSRQSDARNDQVIDINEDLECSSDQVTSRDEHWWIFWYLITNQDYLRSSHIRSTLDISAALGPC